MNSKRINNNDMFNIVERAHHATHEDLSQLAHYDPFLLSDTRHLLKSVRASINLGHWGYASLENGLMRLRMRLTAKPHTCPCIMSR